MTWRIALPSAGCSASNCTASASRRSVSGMMLVRRVSRLAEQPRDVAEQLDQQLARLGIDGAGADQLGVQEAAESVSAAVRCAQSFYACDDVQSATAFGLRWLELSPRRVAAFLRVGGRRLLLELRQAGGVQAGHARIVDGVRQSSSRDHASMPSRTACRRRCESTSASGSRSSSSARQRRSTSVALLQLGAAMRPACDHGLEIVDAAHDTHTRLPRGWSAHCRRACASAEIRMPACRARGARQRLQMRTPSLLHESRCDRRR